MDFVQIYLKHLNKIAITTGTNFLAFFSVIFILFFPPESGSTF